MAQGDRDSIAALRRAHEDFAAFVATLGDGDLSKRSGSSEWTLAQVLSHLGAAAEIGLNTLRAGQADMGAAQGIWDRWNAMSPEEQASGFLAADEALVAALESLSDADLADKKLDLGFLPAPIAVGFYVSMRASEVSQHWWDVQVVGDPAATVPEYIVPSVLPILPVFAGFFAKPLGRAGQVDIETAAPTGHYTLDLTDDAVTLSEGAATGAGTRLSLDGEALVRLIGGRLGAEHTPASVNIEGDFTLDDLRRVFPGY